MTKISSISAAIQALLALLILLGWVNLTSEQLAGIIAAFNACLLAAHAWFSPIVPWFGVTETETDG